MKKALTFLVVLASAAAARAQPAPRELRVIAHVDMRSSDTSPACADAAGHALAPMPQASAMDTVRVIGAGVIRTETGRTVNQRFETDPLIVIRRTDGDVILDAGQSTYFRTPPAPSIDPAKLPQDLLVRARSIVRFTRTNDVDLVAGINAQRILFAFDVPCASGTVASVETSGELWLADQLADYDFTVGQPDFLGTILSGGALVSIGRPRGFLMKCVVRGGMIGANEFTMTVTSIQEEPLQPDLFEPPPGYVERKIGGLAPYTPAAGVR
jgi:hypothetical protein